MKRKALLGLAAIAVFFLSSKSAGTDTPSPPAGDLPAADSFITGAFISFAISIGATDAQLSELTAAFGGRFSSLSLSTQELFRGFMGAAGFRGRVAQRAILAQDPTAADFRTIEGALADPTLLNAPDELRR